LKKADVAVIGGSGLETFLKGMEQIYAGTLYGIPPPISVGDVDGKSVAFCLATIFTTLFLPTR
jgi:purine nucleoside phosphorylase